MNWLPKRKEGKGDGEHECSFASYHGEGGITVMWNEGWVFLSEEYKKKINALIEKAIGDARRRKLEES